MLFRKDMDPRCAYCQRGQQINEREVACVKRGIVAVEHHCPQKPERLIVGGGGSMNPVLLAHIYIRHRRTEEKILQSISSICQN